MIWSDRINEVTDDDKNDEEHCYRSTVEFPRLLKKQRVGLYEWWVINPLLTKVIVKIYKNKQTKNKMTRRDAVSRKEMEWI